ncbi:MAG TPA: ribose 5-phosphate isomerase B [Chitinophagaceae bacterium]|nr:ribose 5-phosphate isomerase B [Chitinophagaceae bacterium]
MSFDTSKPVAIGSDHAGFDQKQVLVKFLNEKGIQVSDFGVYENKSVDYPDHEHPVATAVENGECSFGILLCGSANGVCMTANKHQGIRAALCWQVDIAKLSRQHNDANVICIPARFVADEYAKHILQAFMDADFEGGRHANRVNKISCSTTSHV